MSWDVILINFLIGLCTGVLSSIITNICFVRQLEKWDIYRIKLKEIYSFFYKLEHDANVMTIDEICNNQLMCRNLFKRNKKLMNAFDSVDALLSNLIKLKIENGVVSFNPLDESYIKFKTLLEKRI